MVRNSSVIKLVPFHALNKIILITITALSFSLAAFADCTHQTPPFDSSREEVVALITNWFGAPDKVTTGHIRWVLPGTTEQSSFFTVLFENEKVLGTSIFTSLVGSSTAAADLVKLADAWEESLKEEGFVFVKNGKTSLKEITSIYKEYECQADRRIRTRISLTKTTTSNVIAADVYTYRNSKGVK
jgi:hypothetical protein